MADLLLISFETEGAVRVRRAEFVKPRRRFECREKGNRAVAAVAEVAEIDGPDGSTPLNSVPRELKSIRHTWERKGQCTIQQPPSVV